jgi:hypothetical protein
MGIASHRPKVVIHKCDDKRPLTILISRILFIALRGLPVTFKAFTSYSHTYIHIVQAWGHSQLRYHEHR